MRTASTQFGTASTPTQRRNILRRLTKITLVLALVAAFALPAAVRSTRVAALSCGPCPATTTDDLNLRDGPSLDADVLLVMPTGAAISWDPTQGETNAYVAVTYDGTDGWAASDYLYLYPGAATTTDNLNLRAEPSLDAELLLVMPAGTTVTTIGGPSNGFFEVRTDLGEHGWASADYLDISQWHGGDVGFPIGAIVTVATDALNLRDAPGLNGAVLDVLPTGAEGTTLTSPTAIDGYMWYQVDFGAAHGTGWVAGGYLALLAAGIGFSTGDEVVVVDGPLNYRTEPTLASSIIKALPEGTEGAILDGPIVTDGYTWYQLGLPGYGPDGQTPGWVAGEYLGAI
jgi:uncharacterized protein YgiM (DUF1202 family)